MFPPDHWQVVESLEDLGEMWWRMGEPAKARPLLERAIAVQENKSAGPDMVILYVLAATLRDTGRLREAEGLFKRSLALHDEAAAAGKRVLPGANGLIQLDSPYLGECLQEYAKLLRMTNRAAEAEKLEDRARRIPTDSHRDSP
jgi:tetratricopeptide (TPR) repeat protein